LAQQNSEIQEKKMDALRKIDVADVTGTQRYDRYIAVRTTQGGRTLFTVQVRLCDVPVVLPVPDPDRPTPGNRRVNLQHARKFGEYVRDKKDWVAPPLLVRDDGHCRFTKEQDLPGEMAIGYLDVPRSSRALRIIDGQHRVLGVALQQKDIEVQLDRIEEELARVKDDVKKEQLLEQGEALKAQDARLQAEHFTMQIYVESEVANFEQMFFDVADNALGINQAVKVRFDSRKVLNRTLYEVNKHALLVGRVDEEQDRITQNNPNLLGAKHVIDLVRSANVGVTGRIGAKREAEFEESTLIEAANDYFDCLLKGFEDPLEALVTGEIDAPTLRASSLLGSVSMLRVLAGVYFEFVEADYSSDDVSEFFSQLAPHMKAPITADSLWMKTDAKQDFTIGAMAPLAKSTNLKHLTEEIVRWSDKPPAGL
jgi:DNA-sulfur modification-associated